MTVTSRFLYLINWFRVLLSKNVKVSIHSRISRGTNIKTDDHSSIFIGDGFHCKRNVTIHSFGLGQIKIGNNVFVNENCMLVACDNISIGNNVTIGPHTVIYDHDHGFKSSDDYISERIEIEDNVWIGAGCIILKGVSIGHDSIVAAGTVLTKSIPPKTMVRNSKDLIETDL